MDLEKLTDRARGFLQAAQTIAVREHHQRIAPAHLLKALLDDEQGMAAGLIEAAGGDAKAAKREVDALVAKGVTPALDITDVAPLGIKVIYLLDPEGNAIEIAQRLAG